MKVYTATMLAASSVWAALGQTDTAVGLWGTLFVFSVLLPSLWRTSWTVPVGYLLGLIAMWARDQWVLFTLSLVLAGFSLVEPTLSFSRG